MSYTANITSVSAVFILYVSNTLWVTPLPAAVRPGRDELHAAVPRQSQGGGAGVFRRRREPTGGATCLGGAGSEGAEGPAAARTCPGHRQRKLVSSTVA